MPVLGNIIKGLIHAKGYISSDRNPVEEQKDVLLHLLEKASNTAFGKHYDFKNILQSKNIQEAFAKR
ncbi:MAG: GH3 auxin-responsive promoter, partial [Croceitalea sp.]|nr:GH3 auxin-responsive promoter [Croceitalea sp.]